MYTKMFALSMNDSTENGFGEWFLWPSTLDQSVCSLLTVQAMCVEENEMHTLEFIGHSDKSYQHIYG